MFLKITAAIFSINVLLGFVAFGYILYLIFNNTVISILGSLIYAAIVIIGIKPATETRQSRL